MGSFFLRQRKWKHLLIKPKPQQPDQTWKTHEMFTSLLKGDLALPVNLLDRQYVLQISQAGIIDLTHLLGGAIGGRFRGNFESFYAKVAEYIGGVYLVTQLPSPHIADLLIVLYFVATSKFGKIFSSADKDMLHGFAMQLMAGLGNILETLLRNFAFGNAASIIPIQRPIRLKRRRSGIDAKHGFKQARGAKIKSYDHADKSLRYYRRMQKEHKRRGTQLVAWDGSAVAWK